MPFYTSLKINPEKHSQKEIEKILRVRDNIKVLKSQLSEHISKNRKECFENDSVKIATWNIRKFGGSASGGRRFESLYYIAEIISHFDIVALQEVMANLKELKILKRILGPDWSFMGTDVVDGDAGNGERMIFLFNRKKVSFRGIVGELTLKEGKKITAHFGERIPLGKGFKIELDKDLSGEYRARTKKKKDKFVLDDDLEIELPTDSMLKIPNDSKLVISKGQQIEKTGRGRAKIEVPKTLENPIYKLRFSNQTFEDSLRQFARTPFLISFQSGWLKLNLCTVHIYYGDKSDKDKLEQRRSEIEELTRSLSEKAKNEFSHDKEAFLGVLGDFNIIGKGHATMKALESNGFIIPKELKFIPGTNVEKDKAYDQIAFWNPKKELNYARLDVVGAGVFDFFEHVYVLNKDEETYISEEDNGLNDPEKFKDWRTYKMSDHLPMWIELRTDFSNEYLDFVDDKLGAD